MNLLLINSSDKNAFAAFYCSGSIADVVYSSEFYNVEDSPTSKKPDKLVHCLNKLSKSHNFNNADAIAVTIGPGSFTGIRVGLALAKGIAFGSGKQLIPINNFDILLNRLNERNNTVSYIPIIEAKLPEYYFAEYENLKAIKNGTVNLENIKKIVINDAVVVGDFNDETQLKHYYFKYINVKNCKSELVSFIDLAEKRYTKGKTEDSAAVKPLYIKDFNFRKP
ncbi:MAG: tRNA (adenosine(37)-N6)-threonylcarbamoyltransferase complex dimerization subunit type 1 TsaB [Ignavibacteria bacterium]|nr:tRNA (adenosine(37)-N6)-threonylcarbamoyltransferase complex dimerization subunit type 1 TsaB [Ignavibacteria bacterium]